MVNISMRKCRRTRTLARLKGRLGWLANMLGSNMFSHSRQKRKCRSGQTGKIKALVA